MKKREFILDGETVKRDRASIQYEPTHGFSITQCDLCDGEEYPMFSWCCEHDDPDHITSVCFECLCELTNLRIDN